MWHCEHRSDSKLNGNHADPRESLEHQHHRLASHHWKLGTGSMMKWKRQTAKRIMKTFVARNWNNNKHRPRRQQPTKPEPHRLWTKQKKSWIANAKDSSPDNSNERRLTIKQSIKWNPQCECTICKSYHYDWDYVKRQIIHSKTIDLDYSGQSKHETHTSYYRKFNSKYRENREYSIAQYHSSLGKRSNSTKEVLDWAWNSRR